MQNPREDLQDAVENNSKNGFGAPDANFWNKCDLAIETEDHMMAYLIVFNVIPNTMSFFEYQQSRVEGDCPSSKTRSRKHGLQKHAQSISGHF